jgi:polysaccharide deacetylase family protein (PEP-CTERM system associated)
MPDIKVRKPLPAPVHAMTIDVEDYFHVAAFKDVIHPHQWDSQPSRVVQNTHKILDIFESQNIKGTFFILGWVADKHPELVKAIDQAGHEIASHGYSHQLIYSQTPEIFREETHKSKSLLESLTQKPCDGYRAASYSITKKSLWALDILGELGFKWDSSIFPVYHDNYGIPDTPSEPYQIKTKSGNMIIEFPITSANKFGISIPAAGGGYFRQFPYPVFRYLFNAASNNNTVPKVFYLHPWEVDPDQPRFSDASWFSKFRHYTNLDKCESRLCSLLKDFKFGTLSESLDRYTHNATYMNLDSELVKLC